MDVLSNSICSMSSDGMSPPSSDSLVSLPKGVAYARSCLAVSASCAAAGLSNFSEIFVMKGS